MRFERKSESRNIVSIRVDATSYSDATEWTIRRAKQQESAYVCVANVHMTMEAHDSLAFARIVNSAQLVVPDGMPLVWALRWSGIKEASRVRGPDLALHIAREAARQDLGVALVGGKPEIAQAFADALVRHAPGLRVAPIISPPFRTLSEEEEIDLATQLNQSGARIVFVGLGCPKQEKWMARNSGRINAVLLGVGAAFDFHAGTLPEAPNWMQGAGLEWLFRLIQEPKRLFMRYMRHNPRFIILLARQLLRHRLRDEAR